MVNCQSYLAWDKQNSYKVRLFPETVNVSQTNIDAFICFSDILMYSIVQFCNSSFLAHLHTKYHNWMLCHLLKISSGTDQNMQKSSELIQLHHKFKLADRVLFKFTGTALYDILA